ncbi:trna (adenine-n-)-methyltransferase [Diplodia corticola]|uniref:tRNA (adenine(58)-N(1))-methyltransferase catalytic subunit TRM61 n=1 Tax=Diplodia corticola TaxID=236234 RepID=A0A1J9R603_9PEZI|nr:trna (adenine-n-)-methyltransferase [Diplodia corticola]OJD36950.1 trna (adenine-n-)-methyltransferase [Diplodia corticola]
MHLLARPSPALRAPARCRQCLRSLSTQAHAKVFAEGDVVLLRDRNRPRNPGILTKPLKAGVVIVNQHGSLPHSDIIGKRIRDNLQTTKTQYRIQEPTLDEYVRMTPRIVTPIYPEDASFIVNLFDIHVSPTEPGAAFSPPLEILEAGTGHGGLTLHLARAIHAANPPLPESLRAEYTPVVDPEHPAEEVTYESTIVDHMAEHTLESWKRQRRAVIHTVDHKAKTSKHAKKIVSGFRRGMYANAIDFHVGDVSAWIKARFTAQTKGDATKGPEPFLSYVFLDLPSAEDHLEIVSQALHMDGALAVFNPSVTQIADSVKRVRELGLPLALDKVVELRGSDTVREWDLRAVQPKAAMKAANGTSLNGENEEVDTDEAAAESDQKEKNLAEQAVEEAKDLERIETEQNEELQTGDASWKYVCRPKTGLTMGVGGFVGLWRRFKT